MKKLKEFLHEKDFFDINDDNAIEDQSHALEEKEDSTDIHLKLQLKLLWSNTLYLYRLTRKLYMIDDKFESSFNRFNTIKKIFRDFILNMEDFSQEQKEKFVKLMRQALIESIRKLMSLL